MKSAIYRGAVHHARSHPRLHRFRYRMFMMYLDLEELDTIFAGRWLWSLEHTNVASFRRADFLGPSDVSLDTAVRDRVAHATGTRPLGPIRLLTHLRYFGYVQNPVSFYYCFDATDTRVETIVAEVTNTPWGERHAYVLPVEHGPDGPLGMQLRKRFHVSPFLPMDQEYDWWFSPPAERLQITMQNRAGGVTTFVASLDLRREPITAASLRRVLLHFPWMTLTVVAGIYWQAFRLWWKGAPFHSHP